MSFVGRVSAAGGGGGRRWGGEAPSHMDRKGGRGWGEEAAIKASAPKALPLPPNPDSPSKKTDLGSKEALKLDKQTSESYEICHAHELQEDCP